MLGLCDNYDLGVEGSNEVINVEKFVYKKAAGITVLSASFTDFKYKKHYHQEYAIGVTLRGIQQYHLEGSLHLSYPGGVMLFNPEQAHDGMAYDKSGLEYVMLYIHPDLLLEAAQEKEIVQFQSPVVYNADLKYSILQLTHAILLEKDETLCTELYLDFINKLTQTNLSVRCKKDSVLIGKAKEILRADLKSMLKLEMISKELNLSKYQFIRLFKSHTGITPYQYFLNCKIERAKQIIDEKRDLYEAVAACDFVDLTHLNKHFKKIYGITAFEYMTYLK